MTNFAAPAPRTLQLTAEYALGLFVERLSLRSVLADAERDAILALPGRVQKVEACHDIILPGEHTDHACMMVSGLGGRFDMMADGRRQIVSFYIPGDMCDLHSVPVPTSGWGLEALSAATLLFIPHAALRRLVLDPSLAMIFWRDTIVDSSILAKWVANVGRRQGIARLAHLFCEMGMRMEQVGLGSRSEYSLPAKQAQLADAMGLTAVHLNRTLKSLRDEGVAFNRGHVRIKDWNSLADLAEFDPTYLLLPSTEKR
jgi:CRP-like cAMP-binding protein